MKLYTHQHQFYCGIDLHARATGKTRLKKPAESLLSRITFSMAEIGPVSFQRTAGRCVTSRCGDAR